MFRRLGFRGLGFRRLGFRLLGLRVFGQTRLQLMLTVDFKTSGIGLSTADCRSLNLPSVNWRDLQFPHTGVLARIPDLNDYPASHEIQTPQH